MVPYTLITSFNRASISISINKKGEVIVKAPRWIGKRVIEEFVASKEDWIKSHRELRKQDNPLLHGKQILFLGNPYTLEIKIDPYSIPKVYLDSEKIFINHFRHDQDDIRQRFKRWAIQNGVGHLTQRVNTYSEKLNLSYKSIRIKEVSSIWGSCSPDNNLSFNWRLFLTPSEVLDYVVIHEVCHMIHRDHSSRFWAEVSRHSPQFSYHRDWLKKNHYYLDSF